MTSPLTQMPKPDADNYKAARKLFLVPIFTFSDNAPDEIQKLLERYWTEVRDHIERLESSLGKVTHVYHEMLYAESNEAQEILSMLNPKGASFIQAISESTAKLESTEDRAIVEENSDWQRCLTIGLISNKVMSLAVEGYRETTRKRYEHIAKRIDETLKEGEAGVLFIREDHGVQFQPDIQVFYVAPRSLDAIKRWLEDLYRSSMRRQGASKEAGPEEKAPAAETKENGTPDPKKTS